jgi:hypothetical protein
MTFSLPFVTINLSLSILNYFVALSLLSLIKLIWKTGTLVKSTFHHSVLSSS